MKNAKIMSQKKSYVNIKVITNEKRKSNRLTEQKKNNVMSWEFEVE